jgi:hypothetical protein
VVNLTFKHTDIHDIAYIGENMRQADRDEVMAASGHNPMQSLLLGVRRSDQTITAVSPDGVPLVIFGVVGKSLVTDVGVPWLLGCDEALKYRRHFMTDVPKVLEIMLEKYRMLENYVHVKNRVSVNWLKRMGFKMDEPVLFINSGEYFMRFYMERGEHV